MFFLLNRGLDLNSKGHPACCPASGQDQLYLGTGQTATDAMELPQSVSELCYPWRWTLGKILQLNYLN